MSEIPSIAGQSTAVPRVTPRSHGHEPVVININPADQAGDSVEVSPMASWLSKLSEMPEIRQDLVDRVKAEIAAGTYETDAKLDAALENLMNDL